MGMNVAGVKYRVNRIKDSRSGLQQGVALRCATLAGAGQASQDGGGECLRDAGGMASRKATWDGWRGANAHAITLAQRDEPPRRCVPIAPASRRAGVG